MSHHMSQARKEEYRAAETKRRETAAIRRNGRKEKLAQRSVFA